VSTSEIRFTRSGTVDLAYQVVGEGPLDIVLMIGWVSHLEILRELPEAAQFVDRFAAMGRVVLFDKRGTGLSDRPPGPSTYEEMVPDVLAVMDAVGMERAVLVGWVDAAALALVVAAAHPDRVRALVLGEVVATFTSDDDHPWGADPDVLDALAAAIESAWGQAILLPLIAPSVAGDERIVAWFRRLERMSATPSMAGNLLRTGFTDVRPWLARVTAPALLVHRRDAPLVPGDAMRWLASQLPDARFVEVPGDQTPGYLGDVDGLMDEIEDFLVGTRVGSVAFRRVVTVLFSDVVGSTERAAAVGDRRWHDLLQSHRREVRRLLAGYGGTEVDTAGDGFLVAFDSPTSAIRCGLAMCEASRAAGLDIRIGLHAGEVHCQADGVTGLAVHIGARVAAVAGAGEVLASQTIRDLVIGSDFEFSDHGRHRLKGVPGEWELFTVSHPSPILTGVDVTSSASGTMPGPTQPDPAPPGGPGPAGSEGR
jgi:class 3 adenylate cyclase